MHAIAEPIGGLPHICGDEKVARQLLAAVSQARWHKPIGDLDSRKIRAACAVALHVHQPLLPADDDDPIGQVSVRRLYY